MRRRSVLALAAVFLAAGACAGDGDATLRVYTSVTQNTVDAVVAAFEAEHPDVTVEVFRAPTGELTARLAAEQREGGVRADVLWLTDPLSMQQYARDGLLRAWTPQGAAAVPAAARTETFWGTRLLTMVAVHGETVPAPETWSDLTSPDLAGAVALPDPGFAGSALAVLAFFAGESGYGFDYYRALEANGAVQVAAPGEVITGVAEGRFAVGITLDTLARNAVAQGSPIRIAYPAPGGISLYSPIAVVDDAAGGSAQDFVELVLSTTGQRAIAGTGWQPIRDDVGWTPAGPQVGVDWGPLLDERERLLAEYRSIFGG